MAQRSARNFGGLRKNKGNRMKFGVPVRVRKACGGLEGVGLTFLILALDTG